MTTHSARGLHLSLSTHGSRLMSNRVTGHIPARGGASTLIAYGVILEGNGNYVVGVRGYRDNCVKLASGVDYNHVELAGATSIPANAAVDDQSGTSTNRIVVWGDPSPSITVPSLKLTGDMGFFGASPVSQPSVTGATDSAKLASLLTALDTLGLISDDSA